MDGIGLTEGITSIIDGTWDNTTPPGLGGLDFEKGCSEGSGLLCQARPNPFETPVRLSR